MRKPKATLAAWIVEQRKARDWKSEELATRVGVSDSTVRSWESGRPISQANLATLERLFGLEAPEAGSGPGHDPALVAALTRQSAAIEALVAELGQAREDRQRLDELDALVRSLAERLQDGQGSGAPGGLALPRATTG